MSLNLPYYRPSSPLPSPLPTRLEIETATHLLPTIRNPDYDGRIVVIRDHYVAKYGTYVTENEGHALLFIERHLTIPAPRLYAMYREGGKLYIIMEFIPGESLQILWPSLSKDDKQSIMTQLRCIFDKMRSLGSPGFYGGVSEGPLPHRYFFSRDHNHAITGPFKQEREIGLALAERSRLNWIENNQHGWVSEFFARSLPSALKNHPSTFSHSDLHPENILIQQIWTPLSEEKHYEVAAIVDWETAGWYPEYWEYAAAFVLFQWVDDWPEHFERIVGPCPLEAAMLKLVHQDLEF